MPEPKLIQNLIVEVPKVALLAGGLATRMRPLTLSTAKSMLAVADRPFLDHQLRLLAEQGFRRIVICCGHFSDQLREYAGDGSAWGCEIEYSPDGEAALGTGGALRNALPLLGARFLVMYGDSYLPAPFAPVWEAFLRSGRDALMTVYRNENCWDQSNVHFDGARLLSYSKQSQKPQMRHIDYGLSCFRSRVFEQWPENVRFDLADVFPALLQEDRVAGFEVKERFYEIGSPAGLAETDALLRAAAGAQAAQP